MQKLFVLLCCVIAVSSWQIDYFSLGKEVFKNYVTRVLENSGNETDCVADLKTYITNLTNSEKWAMQMFDATAKLQPGLYTGNVIQTGNFDQCLPIKHAFIDKEIKAQYCTAVVTPSAKNGAELRTLLSAETVTTSVGVNNSKVTSMVDIVKMSWGFCLPVSCSTEELNRLWKYAEDQYEFKFHVKFNDKMCTNLEKRSDLAPIEIATMIGLGVVLFIVLISTLYDLLIFQKRKDTSEEYNVLMAFSLYTNAQKLLSTNQREGTITCLSGIRAISMMWIILGHRFVANAMAPNINAIYLFEWQKKIENTFIVGAMASVDTFFFLGGFLVVYVVLLARSLGFKVTIFRFYLNRLFRLVPALFATVFLYMGVLSRLGDGPYWPMISSLFKNDCMDHWWSTLLFVQNYLHPIHMCVHQTYYIAIDTQLYVFAPLIICALVRWTKRTIAGLVTLIILSAVVAFGVTWIFDLNDAYATLDHDYFKQIYLPTHIRMPPWLIGNIFGYYLFKNKDVQIVMRKSLVTILWIIAVCAMLGVVMSHIMFGYYQSAILRTSLFNALYRISWTLSLCWIVFACIQGYGGYINKFLSLPIFTVLARLNYSMFLLHVAAIAIVTAQNRTPVYLSDLTIFHQFWGDFMFTVGIAVIWTLLFESPLLIIEKILFKKEYELHKSLQKKNKSNLFGDVIYVINNVESKKE